MSCFFKIFHHFWSNGVPSSIWFVIIPTKPLFFASGPQECPMSFHKSWSIFSNFTLCQGTKILSSFSVDVYVVEHGHKDDSITEFFRFDVGISPGRFGWREEFPMLWIVGNFSTRIQLVLHLIPTAHWKNCSPLEKLATWPFHGSIASPEVWIFPKHNTESE